MSKFLGLREEHMDLFGTLSNGTYTSGHTFISSETGEVAGNVIQKMADQVALWKAKVMVVASAPSGTTFTLKIKGAKDLTAQGALNNPVTLVTIAGLSAVLTQNGVLANEKIGKMIFDSVIPEGYGYYQVTLTPSQAATGCKVEGWIEPEFN